MNCKWIENTKKPIIGLAPMDGYTDYPQRTITARYGNPDFMMTEFVNVIGVIRGFDRLSKILYYDEAQRPTIAQLFGNEPKYYYVASIMMCSLGFDGIDINMGCPARKIYNRGAGAGLIGNYELAEKIIESVKKGVSDYNKGISLDSIDNVPNKLTEKIANLKSKLNISNPNCNPTISVKTRIRDSRVKTKEWISFLVKQDLDFLSIHGRTRKQKFTGESNWDDIKYCKTLCPNLTVFGNGDITDMNICARKIQYNGVNGALIGRAAIGNPWIFKDIEQIKSPVSRVDTKLHIATIQEKVEVLENHFVLHCEFYNGSIHGFRKYIVQYLKGVEGLKSMKKQLLLAESKGDVLSLLNKLRTVDKGL